MKYKKSRMKPGMELVKAQIYIFLLKFNCLSYFYLENLQISPPKKSFTLVPFSLDPKP